MKRFITGTDTGVGKTTVTAALAAHVRSLGKSVFAFKPIETGGEADQQVLGNGLYSFVLPRAPWVASTAEGVTIDLDRIAERVSRETSDVILVEGAGGWRVPITADADMSSLARRLLAPVIVVARAGLGTINHSLLTVQAVEQDGLEVAAVVLSHRPEDDPEFTRSNAEQIRHRWSGSVLIYSGDPADLQSLLAGD